MKKELNIKLDDTITKGWKTFSKLSNQNQNRTEETLPAGWEKYETHTIWI